MNLQTLHLSDAELDRVVELRADGMPMTWIAETIGRGAKRLRLRFPVDPEANREWQSVWSEIMKNPDLLALHHEFAPRSKGGAYGGEHGAALNDSPRDIGMGENAA